MHIDSSVWALIHLYGGVILAPWYLVVNFKAIQVIQIWPCVGKLNQPTENFGRFLQYKGRPPGQHREVYTRLLKLNADLSVFGDLPGMFTLWPECTLPEHNLDTLCSKLSL